MKIVRLTRRGSLRDQILLALGDRLYHRACDLVSSSRKRSGVYAALSRLKRQGIVDCFLAEPVPSRKHRASYWMLNMKLTVEEAKAMLLKGVEFGVVFVCVAENERGALREWYVRRAGLPNLAARNTSRPEGNSCQRCGGFLVRTGTCETCQECGENAGCG